MKMKVKYVEFLYPGVLFNETSLSPRETDKPQSIKIPEGAYAFRFCERTEGKIKGEEVIGKWQYDPKTYYARGGKVFTLAEVKAGAISGDCNILISNMECNGYDRVIKTNRGNVQPFDTNCVLL